MLDLTGMILSDLSPLSLLFIVFVINTKTLERKKWFFWSRFK